MFKKKLLALALATVMTLSTSVVAFAATTPSTKGEADAATNTTVYNFSASATTLQAGDVTATGSVQQPQIKVTVPTSNSYVINPYQLKVKVPDASKVDGSDSTTDSQAQIISPSYSVKSDSDVDLKVNVQVKGTPSTGVTLTTGTIAANDTKKDVLLYVNFDVTTPTGVAALKSATFNADGTQADKTSFSEGETVYAIDKSQIVKDGDTYKITDDVQSLIDDPVAYVVTTAAKTYTNDDKSKTNYTLVTYKFLADGDYDSKADNQVAVTTAATTKTAIASLDARDKTGAVTEATYSFKGKTATNPTTPWSSNDNVKVTLTFTFTPVVTEIASGN